VKKHEELYSIISKYFTTENESTHLSVTFRLQIVVKPHHGGKRGGKVHQVSP
jgi:hypothetical protein